MKQSIGTTFMLNYIILFFVVTFVFILGIMSYMKAFRLNSRIANAIENHEGYNKLAKDEITSALESYGYRYNEKGNKNCPIKNGKKAIGAAADNSSQKHRYCIYEYNKKAGYFKYGIITYIYLDLPVVGGTFAVPVYSETEKIYEFNV